MSVLPNRTTLRANRQPSRPRPTTIRPRGTGGNSQIDNIGGSIQNRRNMWEYDPNTINDNFSSLSPIPIRPI